MTGHKSLEELMAEPYRRWYQFGWRSPNILYRRFRNKHKWIFRLKMAWQRATRGYGDDDLWSLNYTVAQLIVVGCRNMRENGYSYPTEFSDAPHGDGTGWASWEAILLKIEAGFQLWLDEDGWLRTPEQEAQFEEAMRLYAKWFSGLWD